MQAELLRKQYDFELEQRNSLTAATNIPLVGITVVASALSVISVDFRYEFEYSTYLFAIFGLATLIAIVFSIHSIFRSFWNYEWKKLPRSQDLLLHSEELYNWHLKNGSSSIEARYLSNNDFHDYLNLKIAEASDWNGQNNIVRGNYLHRSTAAIALGIALLLPTALIYAHNKVSAEEKVHLVRLVAPNSTPSKEKSMSNNQSSVNADQTAPAPAAPSPAPASTPTAAPATKPSGPPNLLFKGSSELTKPGADSSAIKKLAPN
ncbi:hypothetical protein [Variovorax sp. PCZ-1]|uniref:hypothetical protein n=1 Tax=Variovorax sp. PCZ-1 TaxID=2835533 RepID=UPI001BCDF033|nr:hypothetical protein [Variovorax sp. PCZ-1]MBS7808243.1 hypothetical protein [Variovorax sp. PCZ-1]